MKNQIGLFYLAIIMCLASCNSEKKKGESIDASLEQTDLDSGKKKTDKAEVLVAETIRAHGGNRYDDAFYEFTFRGKRYTFQNKKKSFIYTMKWEADGKEIVDSLQNGKLTHTVNGMETEISQKDIAKYTEDVNSVVYFATLPHKLNDPAVNKTYMGETVIKGEDYAIIGVTFDEEGGGVDHEDKFMYWINSDTKTMDYLAYNYETNVGGVRFRSAYNPRTVGGIRFQDYINYKAPIGTPLQDLPALYESGQLEELSRIETENVVQLTN